MIYTVINTLGKVLLSETQIHNGQPEQLINKQLIRTALHTILTEYVLRIVCDNKQRFVHIEVYISFKPY